MNKLVLPVFAVLLFSTLHTASAQLVAPGGGKIAMDAAESQITPQYILYKTAHMTTQSGSVLDADELKAVVGANNQLETATATGNVKAFVDDAANNRKYAVSADMAVFDPKENTIDLTGNVKTVITSLYTDGPLVQTGTSATVQLGKAPDFPQIVMRQTHTTFSVKQ